MHGKGQHQTLLGLPQGISLHRGKFESHYQCNITLLPVCAESVVYVEVKHWKSLSKKMSTLGWSFAPIEMFINVSTEQPTTRQAPCHHSIQIHAFISGL